MRRRWMVLTMRTVLVCREGSGIALGFADLEVLVVWLA
jgi:hypothetical protein